MERILMRATEIVNRTGEPFSLPVVLYKGVKGDYNRAWDERAVMAFSPVLFFFPGRRLRP